MLGRLSDWRAGRLVGRAQAVVAGFDPHPNYDAVYRRQERSYWTHIPGWIWRDQRPSTLALDIGPGFGTLMVFSHLATGATVHGIDFDPIYMTEGLKAIDGIKWHQANVELDDLPWAGPYDFIVFSEVLEHLNFDAVPTLRRMASVLRPGGRIYLSTPDAAEWGATTVYYNHYHELPQPSEDLRDTVVDDHVWQFNQQELAEVLTDAGLEVVRSAFAPGVADRRHFNLTLQPTA